jgi:uncharacterized protein (TIRG00374 family)
MRGTSISMFKPRRQIIIFFAIVSVLLIAILVILLDWKEIKRVLGQANWEFTIVALIFTVISYGFLSFAFVEITKLFGIRVRALNLMEISYVGTTLDNIMAFGGTAGLSLRLLLLQRRGIPLNKAISASIFNSYLVGLIMLSLLSICLIYLLANKSVHGGGAIGTGLSIIIIVCLFILATAIIFSISIRSTVLYALIKIVRVILHRDITSYLNNFSSSLSIATASIHKNPITLLKPVVLVIAYWLTMLLVLLFGFYALGNPLKLGVLLTGFSVGISAGNASMIPGGFGVQETSMAGIYALLGVSFESAILAAILFRVIYDFIPFFISLAIYRRLLVIAS